MEEEVCWKRGDRGFFRKIFAYSGWLSEYALSKAWKKFVECTWLGALDATGTTFYLTDALGSILSSFSNTASSAAVKGTQVFGPYGKARYAKGTINTAKGFTGQYNDGLTGLDYYNARYYGPVAGVFLSADSVQGNLQGMNPYAYVGGNPETYNDPSGHCWPFCAITAAIGAVVGATVGIVGEAAQHGTDFSHYNWGHVAVNAAVGGVAGFMIGTGVGTAAGIGMITGGVFSAIGAVSSHQSFAAGLQSVFEGAAVGGIIGGLTAGVGNEFNLGARQLFQGSTGIGKALLQGGIQFVGGSVGDVGTQVWNSWRSGDPHPQFNWGELATAGAISFGAGFVGQWVFNHVQTWSDDGAYASRGSRDLQRGINWDTQNGVAMAVSGITQGITTSIVQYTEQSYPEATLHGPR